MLREDGGRRGCVGSMMDHERCRLGGLIVSAAGLPWLFEETLSLCTHM